MQNSGVRNIPVDKCPRGLTRGSRAKHICITLRIFFPPDLDEVGREGAGPVAKSRNETVKSKQMYSGWRNKRSSVTLARSPSKTAR